MTIHAVHAVGFPTETPYEIAAPSGLGVLDTLTVDPTDLIAYIGEVVEPLIGVRFSIAETDLQPGDLIVVVGAPGDIPDYQVGASFLVDSSGLAHFLNAGHLTAAFTAED